MTISKQCYNVLNKISVMWLKSIFSRQASRMTISKLASDVAENQWETKGMKHALEAERDYNLMTTQKLERLKVQNAYSLGWGQCVGAMIHDGHVGHH